MTKSKGMIGAAVFIIAKNYLWCGSDDDPYYSWAIELDFLTPDEIKVLEKVSKKIDSM